MAATPAHTRRVPGTARQADPDSAGEELGCAPCFSGPQGRVLQGRGELRDQPPRTRTR
ncbi:hypothetical protein [Streptomyces sp. NPDC002324]